MATHIWLRGEFQYREVLEDPEFVVARINAAWLSDDIGPLVAFKQVSGTFYYYVFDIEAVGSSDDG